MNRGNAYSALNGFRAAWWLPGGHLQSLRRKFGPGVAVAQEGERLPLEDGDFIDLAWVRPGGEIAPGDPVVFILHGLCGCSESLYVQARRRQRGDEFPRLQRRAQQQGAQLSFRGFRRCRSGITEVA